MSATVTREQVRVQGAPVATATVVDDGANVTLCIEINDSHAPARARRELMERTFLLPAFQHPRRVRVAIPIGEPDLINSLAGYLEDVRSRAAGVTCLIEGVVTGEGGSHDDS